MSPTLQFPLYAYVPGETPHPLRAAPGRHRLAHVDDISTAIFYGIDLFDNGYFWEAHEVWETAWRDAERDSDPWLFRKSLIRLAAAALKLRVGSQAGVKAHAPWCAHSFTDLARRHPAIDGLSPADLAEFANDIASGRMTLTDAREDCPAVLDRALPRIDAP
ncbi:MAG: DUF309 domain-containing protein [Pseudomonadota bacterium]